MSPSFRIPGARRAVLSALLLTSWLTGVGFFILDSWVRVEGEFGPAKHPWQFSILKIHGAAAFLAMIAFGYLLASHVPAGWRVRRMRPLGLVLVCAVPFLIVTAYLLYYLGEEGVRFYVGRMHALVGFLLPLLVGVHLWDGARRRPKRRGASVA